MKTAMMELIEYFNSNKLWPKNEIWLIEIDKKIGEWKEKEKEQIMDAYKRLRFPPPNDMNMEQSANNYYSKTYKPLNNDQ